MADNLSKNILSTVAYYDVMDYPMTAFEIWKHLIGESCTLADVIGELEKEEIKKYISEFRGFYFLKDRKDLVEQRIERNKISNWKLKKARGIIFWLRLVPFVKMIAVAGRVGAKNSRSGSDIDMLIIFKHGKIFTGRFLATVLVHFLGERRHEDKISNRICFNHFITDKLEVCVQDLYSSHNYIFITPLYGGDLFGKFLEKNVWIKNYRSNFSFLENNLKAVNDSQLSKRVRFFLEKIFSSDRIEKKLKKWQSEKIKKNPLTEKKGGMIICSETELAFWPDFENQGPRIFEKFQENLKKIK
ncbi:MAG: hypothetical protein US30_C0006G0005 [Candidatus Moranbacteria bacterium GW2011_GWF2_36_839]|nr:MAG: hypothetical protein US27_C0006G0012 [Candidatus Moranbacteria bacterium GW2011_GWF1_36_78]KKQ17116.1 MAG: hypothetical protein US30_C0006G0005 [Candidatus Moranbacteria bacterium GW2011_GWF2_36_839]HAT74108.1 hypothetical protein [Candidatus Moranbacteria bacterium]HBY10684.1 hypothetical protein [Candidatus Moranbacteria bacterium]